MTPPVVGHVLWYPDGPRGEYGLGYTYVVDSYGVWVESEGPHLAARVPVAVGGPLRGLGDCGGERLALAHGPVPARLFELALGVFLASPSEERYVAVIWEGGEYRLRVPEQTGGAGQVAYERVAGRVLEMHSHGALPAFFSGQDNRDEQGFGVFGVVGRSRRGGLVARFRVGIYGHFAAVEPGQVFDGPISAAAEEELPTVELEASMLGREAPIDLGDPGWPKESEVEGG